MTDKLPITTGMHAVNTTATASTSLIGRGLSVIQLKETGLARAELDARYRQARDIYNRITDYGGERRFDSESIPKQSVQLDLFEDNPLQPFFTMLRQLADVFTVFQQLADQGYGKAYFTLAKIYQGGQGIRPNIEKVGYYSKMAFDWCFANQALNDPEIWTDLGEMFNKGCSVEQDDVQAVFWYRLAAEQGYAEAQLNLAAMYSNGLGVEQDDEQAVFWYSKGTSTK